MKKNLLLFPSLLLLLLVYSSFAQTNIYHPFPEDRAAWLSHRYWAGTKFIDQFEIHGDTTLEGVQYKKIYNTYGSSIEYIGGFRQNIAQKKVYIRYKFSPETLMHDFDLQVGDTLKDYYSMKDTVTVTSIDSILIGTNYHKVFRLKNKNPLYLMGFLIEGVGNSGGFGAKYDYISTNEYRLLCFSVNNVKLYSTANTSGCNLVLGIGDILDNMISIGVFPNPTADAVTLSIDCKDNFSIDVKNNVGQTLYRASQLHQSSFQLDLNTYPAGIYYVQLQDGKGNCVVKKVVKD